MIRYSKVFWKNCLGKAVLDCKKDEKQLEALAKPQIQDYCQAIFVVGMQSGVDRNGFILGQVFRYFPIF